MFPIPWNFPLRKKNGNLVNIGDAIDEGTELPSHGEGDAGKVLSVDENGDLEWSDDVNIEIQTLTNNLDDEVETRAKLTAHNLLPHIIYTDSSNDVHFSIDKDGIVILYTEASGATSDTSFSVSSNGERNLTYETGNYYLSGCPSDGNNNIAVKLNPRDGSNVYDYGNSALISLSGTDIYKVEVWIKSGTIITTPITFKPMVTLATDARHSYSDFTPYVPTNAELLSADTNAVLGAHNLLPNPLATKTDGGVTYTVQSDGSYICNGTGGSSASAYDFPDMPVDANSSYVLSGYAGTNGNSNVLLIARCRDASNNTLAQFSNGIASDNELVFTTPPNTVKIAFRLYVGIGVTVSNEHVYPMIRLASDPSTEYTPYAMTNRELTEDVNNLIIPVSLTVDSVTISGNSVSDIKLNDSTSINVSDKIPSGYKLGAVIFTWSTAHSCVPTQCYVSSAQNYRSFALSLYNITSGNITVNSIDVVLICKRA